MKEIRSIENSEVRVIPNSRKVNGYALLFNIESQDLGGFRENILPEALNGVLEKSDILATYNHDENSVLARNTNGSGTLGFSLDVQGTIHKIRWNHTLANGGFDLTNLDEVYLKYWS